MRCSPEERRKRSTSGRSGSSRYFWKVFSVMALGLRVPACTSRAMAASAVVDAHGEGADGVVTGFAFALFELFDDVFPEFGAAACPADAYSPGFEGFELAVEDFGGESHDEGDFAG